MKFEYITVGARFWYHGDLHEKVSPTHYSCEIDNYEIRYPWHDYGEVVAHLSIPSPSLEERVAALEVKLLRREPRLHDTYNLAATGNYRLQAYCWPEDEDTWIACAPLLSISTQGDNAVHAARMIKEAVAMCVDDDLAEGYDSLQVREADPELLVEMSRLHAESTAIELTEGLRRPFTFTWFVEPLATPGATDAPVTVWAQR